ncbi:MAG: HD domain-containing protein [Thermodesulfobacteriota bacterium]
MTPEQVDRLKHWFEAYADGFASRAANPEGYLLKKNHTFRVCREIVSLGRELGLDHHALLLAEAAACLHDVGRFRQLDQYGTFVDDLSEDHARIGLRVIEEERLLDGWDVREAEILRAAVAFHNAAALPGDQEEVALVFIKLLRDADKLDIWRVVTTDDQFRNTATPALIALGMTDDGQYSPEALQAVAEKRLVNKSAISRLNDFKLMQISWVFDLNFPPAVRKVIERGYIPAIMATLPASKELTAVFGQVEEWLKPFAP